MLNQYSIINEIRKKVPECEVFDELDEWKEKLSYNEILTVLHINIRSIRKNWDLLYIKIVDLLPKLDLLILTEVNVKDEEAVVYQLRGHAQLNKCRIRRNGGGVIAFVKNCWQVEDMGFCFEESETINFKLTHSDRKVSFIISAIYRSPKLNLDAFLHDLNFWLEHVIKKDDNVVIVGDINCCTLKKNSTNTRYLNILYNNTVLPTIKKPTREEMVEGKQTISCIDHVNVRLKQNTFYSNTSTIIMDKLADHYWIACRITQKNNNVRRNKTPEFVNILNNKKVQQDIEKTDWTELNEISDPVTLHEKLCTKFEGIYESSIKTVKKNTYKHTAPWINERVKIAIQTKQQILKQWRNNKNNRLLYEQYKEQRNITTNVIKKEKRIYLYKLFQDAKGDMRKTWGLINDLMNRKIKEPIETQLKRNFKTNDLKLLANDFNNNFLNQITVIRNLNSGPLLDVKVREHELQRVNSSMYLRMMTNKDVHNILKKLKKTGRGIDGIRHKDIITNRLMFTPTITKLVNLMLSQSNIPPALKVSCITPLYKGKGPVDAYKSHRPVGSMPLVEKVLEKHINNQMMKYLNENNIIPEFQHGFQTGRSTMTLLQEFADQINTALDQRKCVVVLLLDLSFAFDTISHSRLIQKLQDIGIHHPIFTNYFEGRKQRTRIGDEKSAEKSVNQGLIQGAIGSPTLYSVYTYDVKYIERTGYLKMFADDSCIVAIHRDVRTAVQIAQKDFINLQKYFYNNEIYLNQMKTEAMVLGFKSQKMDMNEHRIYCHSRRCLEMKTYENPSCGCHQVEYSDTVRYLGVYLDRDFHMKQHVYNLTKKMRILKYNFDKIHLEKLPFSTKKTIYFSLIDSLLRYGSTLYTYSPNYALDPLCKLQRRIKRTLFEDKRINCLTPGELAIFITLTTYFTDERFRKLHQHPHSLRIQRFARTKVYSIEFGDRRLEYLMPTLLNTFCQEFLEERKKEIIKEKIKKSLLARR